jgi:beta-glucanase (GH16 family)
MTKIWKPTATLAVLLSCVYCSSTLLADPPAGSKWEPFTELTDEFEGDKLNSTKWHDHNPTWKGRQPAFFSKKNVTVSDDKLHLTARAEDLPDLPEGYHTFTTAAVKSKAKVLYGYFEIKCKPMDSIASSAFWFYAQDPDKDKTKWWTEIDVFEICGRSPTKDPTKDRTYHMTAHVFVTPEDGKKHWKKGGRWQAPFRLADDFHVYALEWNKHVIKWYVDGKVVRELKNTHWHQPLHMNFDSETFPGWFGLPKKENLPSTFSIDYIRSWKKTENAEPEDAGDKK